ncbi:hypothetical protein U1Q18_052165 [Sarracenia purpurea var. burkii]
MYVHFCLRYQSAFKASSPPQSGQSGAQQVLHVWATDDILKLLFELLRLRWISIEAMDGTGRCWNTFVGLEGILSFTASESSLEICSMTSCESLLHGAIVATERNARDRLSHLLQVQVRSLVRESVSATHPADLQADQSTVSMHLSTCFFSLWVRVDELLGGVEPVCEDPTRSELLGCFLEP